MEIKVPENTLFGTLGPLVCKRVGLETPISNPNLYPVARIIVLHFQKDQSIGTKVIARKPLRLQTHDKDNPITIYLAPKFVLSFKMWQG